MAADFVRTLPLETGLAVLLFAAAFLWGSRFHPLRRWVRDRRTMLSFGGGMAAAYMFVHVMPELNTARHAFAEAMTDWVRFEGASIYFVALVGFLVFYALDHLQLSHRRRETPNRPAAAWTHFGGFAVYTWLVSYLLVHGLDAKAETASTGLYALAMALHFLALDHSLQHEHGEEYRRTGRFILAGSCVAGWAFAQLVMLPTEASAMLLAFLCGAIIMNSTLLELPTERDGRIVPFAAGGLLYGLVLLSLN